MDFWNLHGMMVTENRIEKSFFGKAFFKICCLCFLSCKLMSYLVSSRHEQCVFQVWKEVYIVSLLSEGMS